MKRYLTLGIILFLVFCSGDIFAQGPRNGPGWGQGSERRGCSPIEELGLSDAQREEVKKIESRYKNLILTNWEGLMTKRIELQALLREPNSREEAIRSKSRELRELQAEIHGKMIDYQIEVRNVLTPDQVRQWCTMVGSLVSMKSGIGGP